MAEIRIIKTPSEEAQQEAPEWVRQEWIGLVLPFFDITWYEKGAEIGLGEYVRAGYCVKTEIAIKILRPKSSKAAQWWRRWQKKQQKKHPSLGQRIVFDSRTCELI